MYTGRPRYLSFRASVEKTRTVIKLCLSGGLVFLLNTTEDFSLFICAKGFSALLNAAEQRGDLSGVKICNQAPNINHLLVADESSVLLKNDGIKKEERV
jgi:hypothetical protein